MNAYLMKFMNIKLFIPIILLKFNHNVITLPITAFNTRWAQTSINQLHHYTTKLQFIIIFIYL